MVSTICRIRIPPARNPRMRASKIANKAIAAYRHPPPRRRFVLAAAMIILIGCGCFVPPLPEDTPTRRRLMMETGRRAVTARTTERPNDRTAETERPLFVR
jgi:hypothetical protein